jgi:hypothetical protein
MITICDTGPLLAYLNRKDSHHKWAVALMREVRPSMLVCEPVLTEVDPTFQLLEREAVRLEFDLSGHSPRIRTLISAYRQMGLGRCVDRHHGRVANSVSGVNYRSDGTLASRNDRQFRLARKARAELSLSNDGSAHVSSVAG